MKIRIGFGYDAHRFASDRRLVLGGIEISHTKGLLGHSDADVLLHAICDALLGAASLRDIGFHFSDQDQAYKNIDSKVLLQKTLDLIHDKGWSIVNIDCTIVAEAPKMNPHIPAMQECIAKILKITSDEISIKATTNEKMGPVGREEGIVAYAVVLIQKD